MTVLRVYSGAKISLSSRILPHRNHSTSYVSKRYFRYTAKVSCGGWRRFEKGRQARDHDGKKPNTDLHNEVEQKSSPSVSDQPPYEPSRREKMWQDRMEHIRRRIEENPYEALFGYSNRLLRGMGRDWQFKEHNWLQKEMKISISNPFGGREAKLDGSNPTKPAPKVDGNRTVTEPVIDSVYDPVSGRMVARAGSTTTQRGDPEPQSKVEPVKPSTPSLHQQDGAVDIPIKPWVPKVKARPEVAVSFEKPKPSFMMLKEDLPESASHEKDSSKPILAVPSAARGEYERFKTKRFQNLDALEPTSARETRWHERPADLKEDYDHIVSMQAEELESPLLDKKAIGSQRSRGTQCPDPMTTQRLPYDEKKADEEISDYLKQVAHDNLKTKTAMANLRDAEERRRSQSYKLKHPETDLQAEKDIFAYTKRVFGSNLKNQQDDRLAEASKQDVPANAQQKTAKDTARSSYDHLLEQTRQLKSDIESYKTQLADIEKTRNNWTVASDARPSTHGTQSALETSLDRYKNTTVGTKPPVLQTSLHRMNRSSRSSGSPEGRASTAEPSEPKRTHDPVGYNHARETARIEHLQDIVTAPQRRTIPSLAQMFGYDKPKAEVAKPAGRSDGGMLDNEVKSTQAAFHEFESAAKHAKIGNNDSASIPQRVAKELEQKKRDTALVREIRQIYEDKYGEITAEHRQPLEVPILTKAKAIHEHAEDDPANDITSELAAIRNLGGFSDGIATETAATSSNDTPKTAETQLGAKTLASEQTEPVGRQQSVAEPAMPPASTLTAPRPTRTARYIIISFDPDTQSTTTASFDSIPAPTETVIPLTVALRHLNNASEFLPSLEAYKQFSCVPVHAERNLLILRQDRKTDDAPLAPHTSSIRGSPSIEDIAGQPLASESAARSFVAGPKREEPVFSGDWVARKARQQRATIEQMDKLGYKRARRFERRRKWRRAVRFVGGGVVVAGAAVYLAGVGAEVNRAEGRGKVVIGREKE